MSGHGDIYEIGDVVCLNSGSPPMTVVGFSSDGCLVLVYVDMNGNILRESLPQQAVALTELRWTVGNLDADVEFDDEEDDNEGF